MLTSFLVRDCLYIYENQVVVTLPRSASFCVILDASRFPRMVVVKWSNSTTLVSRMHARRVRYDMLCDADGWKMVADESGEEMSFGCRAKELVIQLFRYAVVLITPTGMESDSER